MKPAFIILAVTHLLLVAHFSLTANKPSLQPQNVDKKQAAEVEKEMRFHLVRMPGGRKMEFHIESVVDRNLDIKLTSEEGDDVPIEITKNGEIWTVDLSQLPRGKYTVLFYDFDANRMAHIKVKKRG